MIFGLVFGTSRNPFESARILFFDKIGPSQQPRSLQFIQLYLTEASVLLPVNSVGLHYPNILKEVAIIDYYIGTIAFLHVIIAQQDRIPC